MIKGFNPEETLSQLQNILVDWELIKQEFQLNPLPEEVELKFAEVKQSKTLLFMSLIKQVPSIK